MPSHRQDPTGRARSTPPVLGYARLVRPAGSHPLLPFLDLAVAMDPVTTPNEPSPLWSAAQSSHSTCPDAGRLPAARARRHSAPHSLPRLVSAKLCGFDMGDSHATASDRDPSRQEEDAWRSLKQFARDALDQYGPPGARLGAPLLPAADVPPPAGDWCAGSGSGLQGVEFVAAAAAGGRAAACRRLVRRLPAPESQSPVRVRLRVWCWD